MAVPWDRASIIVHGTGLVSSVLQAAFLRGKLHLFWGDEEIRMLECVSWWAMIDRGVEEDKQVPYSSFLHVRRIVTCNLFLPQLQLDPIWKLFSQVSAAALDVNVLCVLSETPPPQEPLAHKAKPVGGRLCNSHSVNIKMANSQIFFHIEWPQTCALECSTSGWISKT